MDAEARQLKPTSSAAREVKVGSVPRWSDDVERNGLGASGAILRKITVALLGPRSAAHGKWLVAAETQAGLAIDRAAHLTVTCGR